MNVKKFILAGICSLLFCLTASAAEKKEFRLDIGDFSQLKVNDNLNVEYHCSADSAGLVFFECEPQLSSMLLFTNHKSCLKIQVDDDYAYNETLPLIRVYSSELTKVENDADSTVYLESLAPVNSFKCRVLGNGTVIINSLQAQTVDLGIMTGKGHIVVKEGNAYKANFKNVGTGPIEAGGLTVNQVKIILLGTGKIDCTATESLSIYGMGSGAVYYGGNPAKVSNHTMGVKAYPINTDMPQDN